MSRKRATVLQACVRRHGVHRGAFVAAWVAQWAIASDDLGHVATTVEYSEFWAVSERNAWRHRAAIREVFGEEWPAVVELVAGEIRRRQERSPRRITQLAILGV